MTPAEQEQRVLIVLADNPRQWLSEGFIRTQAGLAVPCYELLRRLGNKHDIISRKGPNGGFFYSPGTKLLPPIEGGRASGKTHRQLEALPDGSAYIIAHMSSVGYFRDVLINMKRDPFSIDFYSLDMLTQDKLRGQRFPAIDMDHFAREVATNDQLLCYLQTVPWVVQL